MSSPLETGRGPGGSGYRSEPEGTIMGAALALTLYGLFIIVIDVATDHVLVPEGGLIGVLIVALLAGGGAVGFMIDKVFHHR